MSRDIRSFFSPKNQTKPASKITEFGDKKKTTNRKRALIESDSDEEDNFKTPKKTKATGSRNSCTKKKKEHEDESKSQYFEVKKEDLTKYFGKVPVKRVKPVEKPKPVEQQNGDSKISDEVRAAAALLDDDDDWFEENPPKTPEAFKQSPVKSNSIKGSPSKEKISNFKSPLKNTSPIKATEKSPLKNSPISSSQPSPIKQFGKVVKTSPKNGEKTESNIEKIENNLKRPLFDDEDDNDVKLSPKKLKEDKKVPENKVSKPPRSIKIIKSPPADKPKAKFELWVDKYKPTTLKQVIGQQGDKSVVNKLLKWLKNWYTNNTGNKKKTKPSPWAKDDDGSFFKAALLSGPPGIGKTTTAHLVSKELGMDIVEFNASDTRSKRLLHEEITELLTSKSLSNFAQGGGATSRSHVLIMDEVDGMAGNEDRGGVQELISLIKVSKVPIICMCNDRNSPKIRSLANYCFDLRLNRPRAEQIKGAMLSICFREGLKIKPEVLNEIITSTNQDIRLVLNYLSMIAAKADSAMNITSKDLKLGAWDVVRKVFSEEENKKMSIHDKCDLFFNDYNIAPLFVQENYLMVQPHSEKAKTKKGKMSLFAKTATSLCYGDLVENGIRSQNAWSLLPTQAVFSSLIPGSTILGHMGGQINFPAWLGKNSRRGKLDRMCQEIQVHTRLRTSGAKESIALDYSKVLKEAIVAPLLSRGTEGIEDSLSVMRHYMLLREDLESLTELNAWPGFKDTFASVDSKVKSAFTRAYNKCPVLTPFSVSGAGVKKMKVSAETLEGEEEEIIEEEEEDNDDVTTDGMIMIKKKGKADAPPKTQKTKEKKKDGAGPSKPRGGKRGGKK